MILVTGSLFFLSAGCGELDPRAGLPEPTEVDAPLGGKADGFSWDYSGQGSFTLSVAANTLITLGDIPAGQQDVLLQVRAPEDVDLQLVDQDETQVVHWEHGVLSGASESSAQYRAMQINWSGSGGIDGNPGNEDLTIDGKLPNSMTVKLYALADCEVTVSYSWAVVVSSRPFIQRLTALAEARPDQVILAYKQGRPAIFVNTASLSAEEAEPFFTALYDMIGGNILMAWNTARERSFHLRTPINTLLEPRFRAKAMIVFRSPYFWNPAAGRLDSEHETLGGNYNFCKEDCGGICWHLTSAECGGFDANCVAYNSCMDQCVADCEIRRAIPQLKLKRAVALIELSDSQISELNSYMAAITDHPEANLGPGDPNGGVPPYLSGDPDGKHNNTSWFSEWLNRKVSPQFPNMHNPAQLIRAYTTGGPDGQLADSFRGLMVFNHDTPPASGANVPKDIPLDFGY